MIIDLVFGDPSGDGHGQHKELLLDIPNSVPIETVRYTISKLNNEFYPCANYGEDFLGRNEMEYLRNAGYPLEWFLAAGDIDTYSSWDDVIQNVTPQNSAFPISAIMDFYLFLIEKEIPGAKVLTVPKFKIYGGYGCFF